MYSYAKRFSKTVQPPLNWNLKTWKVPSSKLFRRRRFFSTGGNFASTGHRAPLSAFVSFAHVHVHTIPVELHPLCPRHAHTFSKSQLTSPLYSESLSPQERNTVENLTNFSFLDPIPSPFITWVISNRTISVRVHFLSSFFPCLANKLRVEIRVSNKIENSLDKTWIIKCTRNKRSKYLWFNHLWLSYFLAPTGKQTIHVAISSEI